MIFASISLVLLIVQMSDPALIKEFQEFSKRTNELQQQYIALVNQILPSKEVENRSLTKAKNELEPLSKDTTVYHSTGKMFLQSDLSTTHEMINNSIETNKRSLAILMERKSVLERALKEAEEKHKFYLSKLGAVQ